MKTKLRGRSFVVNGSPPNSDDRWYVSARIHTDGEIAWLRCGGGTVVDYTPTEKDWQALAVKMAERMDATDEDIESHLEAVQARGANMPSVIQWAAEMADAIQCNSCGHWLTGSHCVDDDSGLCPDCQDESERDACRCGRRDCGDCGHTAPIGPYD